MKLSQEHQNDRDAIQAPADTSVMEPRRSNALTVTGARRPSVVVIGMHRSGTSPCSHILSMLRVDMADVAGANGAR